MSSSNITNPMQKGEAAGQSSDTDQKTSSPGSISDFLVAWNGSTTDQRLSTRKTGSPIEAFLTEHGPDQPAGRPFQDLVDYTRSAVSSANPIFLLENSLAAIQPYAQNNQNKVEVVNRPMLEARLAADETTVLTLALLHSLHESKVAHTLNDGDAAGLCELVERSVNSHAHYAGSYGKAKICLSSWSGSGAPVSDFSLDSAYLLKPPGSVGNRKVEKGVWKRLQPPTEQCTSQPPVTYIRDIASEVASALGSLSRDTEHDLQNERDMLNLKVATEAWGANKKRDFKRRAREIDAALESSRLARQLMKSGAPVRQITSIDNFACSRSDLSEKVKSALNTVKEQALHAVVDEGGDELFDYLTNSCSDDAKHFLDTLDVNAGFMDWDHNLNLVRAARRKELNHEEAASWMTPSFRDEYNSYLVRAEASHNSLPESVRPTEYLTISDPDSASFVAKTEGHKPVSDLASHMTPALRSRIERILSGEGQQVLAEARSAGDTSETIAAYLSEENSLDRARDKLLAGGKSLPGNDLGEWQKVLPPKAWSQFKDRFLQGVPEEKIPPRNP